MKNYYTTIEQSRRLCELGLAQETAGRVMEMSIHTNRCW